MDWLFPHQNRTDPVFTYKAITNICYFGNIFLFWDIGFLFWGLFDMMSESSQKY